MRTFAKRTNNGNYFCKISFHNLCFKVVIIYTKETAVTKSVSNKGDQDERSETEDPFQHDQGL